MRPQRLGALCLCALLAGCASDNGESGYDAGTLPEAAAGDDGATTPDAGGITPGTDAGVDATLPGDDGGAPEAATGDDASDSGSPTDAADAGHDAGGGVDASDAGHDAGVDAADSSVADANDGAADASTADAADGSIADATDDAADTAIDAAPDAFTSDAAAACAGFNLAGDAITGITAATSPDNVALNLTTTDPAQNQEPAADSIVVTATTSPVGIMQDLSIGYFTNLDATAKYVPFSFVTTAANLDNWQASIPPMAAGTQVSFWIVGHDICKSDADAGADYYSNSSQNYHYETK